MTLSLSRAILLTMKTETFSRYLVTLWLRRNLRPVRINWEAVGKPQPSYNEMMRNAARTNKASN